MSKKRLAILGSTGSIGTQALQIADHLNLPVTALAAHRNIDLLCMQIKQFSPKIVAVGDENCAREVKRRFPHLYVTAGSEGIEEAASHEEVDFVLSAITGFAGVRPTLAAICAKKTIGLANKEVLVAAGELVMMQAREKQVSIIPVDSEHSALFQCLEHKNAAEVRRLILTASGGAFLRMSDNEFSQITKEQALIHPNWKMGPKVTIDSSTMMNKGLEVIEAHYLFQMPVDKIDVVIHPQSVVHSMIEMVDGTIFAEMSKPSMLFPIQYAMTWPHRHKSIMPPFSFVEHPILEFLPWNEKRFPCLQLAYEALREGGSFPCALNAANEVFVERFLQGEMSWKDISSKLQDLLARHHKEAVHDFASICAIDAEVRHQARLI